MKHQPVVFVEFERGILQKHVTEKILSRQMHEDDAGTGDSDHGPEDGNETGGFDKLSIVGNY